MAGFLLDTNVVSELVRAQPAPTVLSWMAAQVPAHLFLSAVTMAELVRGVSRLSAGRKRDRLRRWVHNDLARQFEGRVLPFDQEAAIVWGTIMGEADRRGRPRAAIDLQIGAIAIRQGLTLVTRNVADFGGVPVKLINPWPAR